MVSGMAEHFYQALAVRRRSPVWCSRTRMRR